MMKLDSPWVQRFSLGSDAELCARVRTIPPAFEGLDARPPAEAAEGLGHLLKEIYIPSSQDLAAIRRIFSVARAHATTRHLDTRVHLQTLYGGPAADFHEPTTTMITSPAGYGKSKLADACVRLLAEPTMVEVPEHGVARLVSGIRLPHARKQVDTLNHIAMALGQPPTFTSGNAKEMHRASQMLRRDGVCFVLADELQFETSSVNANAQIAKKLNHLRQFGVPLFYIGNYSLAWRLLKRPSEERQRLLMSPLVLVPGTPVDPAWTELLHAYKQVCGQALAIDPVSDAQQIHRWTAGIRRILRFLVEEACRQSRTRALRQRERTIVTMADLRAAYVSQAFSAIREDVEQIRKFELGDETVPRDVRCPFPPEENVARALRESQEKAYQQELSYARLAAEMSQGESAAALRIRNEFGFDTPVPLKATSKGPRRQLPTPSATSLLDGLAAVRGMPRR